MKEVNLTNSIIRQIVGAVVYNSVYDKGYISRFDLREDGKYYVSAVFDSINTEKTYLASAAFAKKALVLEDKGLNEAVIAMLEKHKKGTNKETLETAAKRAVKISPNDNTNRIIGRISDHKQIALELIRYYQDETFERELYGEAFRYLEIIMNGTSLSNAYNACIVAALSLIALKYYDGDLHSYIEKKYREYRPDTESDYSRASVQNAVYKAVGAFRDKVHYFDPHSYVAVPLVLCCVPHYRLKDLFRIAYDIYKRKLLYDEDLSDEQIYEKVLETLNSLRRKDLISDSETIKGTNYLMSKYTQSCIYSGYGIESLSQIITRCIRLIISHLTRPEDSFTVEPYYDEGYTAWVNAFESDDREKVRYETNRTLSQPGLKLIHNRVHLYTGEYSMDDSFDPNDVHILVYANGTLLEDKLITDPNAIDYIDEESAMSGFVIRRQELVIQGNPLENVSYTIVCSGKCLYDSKTRLYRSSMFFDGRGNEIKPGTNYTGGLFVITKGSNKEEYGDRITEEFRGEGYVISSIEVNDRDVFRFDGEPYVFFRISASRLFGYEIPWADFITAEGKHFSIYKDLAVLFPSSCDIEDIYLQIDGKDIHDGEDTDIRYSIQLFSKEHGETWAYTATVYGLEAGFHSIRVCNAKSGKQIKGANYSIVYDSDMGKAFVSKNETGILYDFSASFTGNQQILFEYGIPRKELHAFVKNLGHGSLIIHPTVISYSIDGETWQDINKRIILCEIPESVKAIQVCGPSGMTASYIDPAATGAVNRQGLNLEAVQDNPTEYRLHLSFLRTIRGKNSGRILFEYGRWAKYVAIRFNPFVQREDCRFDYDPDKNAHVFDIRFDSSCKLKAVIKPLHSDSVLVSKVISSGELIEIKDTDIPESIRYLSVSLHGIKYGALFDPYMPEPFMTFPKYDLGRTPVKPTAIQTNLKVYKGILSGEIECDGTAFMKAEIIPGGFKTPLLSKKVQNGSRISLDISLLPFRSYKLLLYCATDSEGTAFDEMPLHISESQTVQPPFLHNVYTISSFTLSDGSAVKVLYKARFYTIREVDSRYWLAATLMDSSNRRVLNDLLVNIRHRSGMKYEVTLRRQADNSAVRIKLNNGKMVEFGVMEQTGGWI